MKNTQATDIVARYGGEEIVLCLNNFDTEENLYNNIDSIIE